VSWIIWFKALTISEAMFGMRFKDMSILMYHFSSGLFFGFLRYILVTEPFTKKRDCAIKQVCKSSSGVVFCPLGARNYDYIWIS
jgi:hypothetical protein